MHVCNTTDSVRRAGLSSTSIIKKLTSSSSKIQLNSTAVCDLVLGKKRPLTLGYFLVRNRGAHSGSHVLPEPDPELQSAPWRNLPTDRVGIPALKEQLSSLLVDITQREFPKLLQDISSQIRECKRELHSLGPPRQDEREQRSFLSHIAEAFQDHARAALAADYNANPAFAEDSNLRLITHVVNITDIFNADFQNTGHARLFEKIGPLESNMALETPPGLGCEETPVGLMIKQLRRLLKKAKVDDVKPSELAELGDIISTPHERNIPWDNFSDWINDVYLKSRGLDLGTFNANLISMAFAEQSRKWGDITEMYMSRVIVTIHRFIAAALRSVCPEEYARSKLWSAILDTLVERYKAAMAQTELLIKVERSKKPYTLNRQFSVALSEAGGHRMTELLRPGARKDTT